ncbi:hypothetical protein DPEC_G00232750 [Dallia pectoralis]|uniref:Uncharacterized protein n=1 Tax=Dallia pectoralis TaxID=75939 RepID=A0ACC2FXR9_DALPE|nr:hypothetical protein DPEC_G00232750 [Dallia pectoralis]
MRSQACCGADLGAAHDVRAEIPGYVEKHATVSVLSVNTASSAACPSWFGHDLVLRPPPSLPSLISPQGLDLRAPQCPAARYAPVSLRGVADSPCDSVLIRLGNSERVAAGKCAIKEAAEDDAAATETSHRVRCSGVQRAARFVCT